MKAYHNITGGQDGTLLTVFQWTKIQNWKLITTGDKITIQEQELYFNELRYKIESLSQLLAIGDSLTADCISMN